jgi:hypothetical protein
LGVGEQEVDRIDVEERQVSEDVLAERLAASRAHPAEETDG